MRPFADTETEINTWVWMRIYRRRESDAGRKNENDAEQYVDGESLAGASTEPNALGISSFMRRGGHNCSLWNLLSILWLHPFGA